MQKTLSMLMSQMWLAVTHHHILSFFSGAHLELLFLICHLNQSFLQQALHSFHVLLLLPHTIQEGESVNIYSFMEQSILPLFYVCMALNTQEACLFRLSSCPYTPLLKLVQNQLGGSLHGYNQRQMEGERGCVKQKGIRTHMVLEKEKRFADLIRNLSLQILNLCLQ